MAIRPEEITSILEQELQKFERKVAPQGPWRYSRPVVLLIGQKCMSSNESFVAMMSGAPQVTIMGDHTCGSSGNPRMVHLPMDIKVSVPKWIDYLPDGTPLDERGFQPYEIVDVLRRPYDGAMGQCDVLFCRRGHWLSAQQRWF